ncbi:MAG TPA: lipopolysaccharide heptosyltransferase II [Kiritimatiellia bacterium]|nr:lipopolysaccharide heptosyltransferase II [Kiritimatiellia bacterium]
MNGSTASASVNDGDASATRELVVSVNWIGDAIMAMPALQEYARRNPGCRLAVLARGVIADIWALQEQPPAIIRYDERPGLFHPLFPAIRSGRFHRAWILPNSFRSAWIPFRAGIPRRIGFDGGYRRVLLTEKRSLPPSENSRHQAWDYLDLLLPDHGLNDLPLPRIAVPESARAAIPASFGRPDRPVIGLIPGAARGPAKRWPPGHFAEVARRLRADGYEIALFGGRDDEPVCREIASALVDGVHALAGKTTVMEWAAYLERCRLIIANDSGGMHLAAALDRPVIALYGLTDPTVTGPLGRQTVTLQNAGPRSRDIARDSAEAQKSLASILPETVYQSARNILNDGVTPGASAPACP